MNKGLLPLWEVKRIRQKDGLKIHIQGFEGTTKAEILEVYERCYGATVKGEVIVAERIDHLFVSALRYDRWQSMRPYLLFIAACLGIPAALLGVFVSLQIGLFSISGVTLSLPSAIAFVAFAYTTADQIADHHIKRPDVERALFLPVHPGNLSAPPIPRSIDVKEQEAQKAE